MFPLIDPIAVNGNRAMYALVVISAAATNEVARNVSCLTRLYFDSLVACTSSASNRQLVWQKRRATPHGPLALNYSMVIA
jgi:hypothetical protein